MSILLMCDRVNLYQRKYYGLFVKMQVNQYSLYFTSTTTDLNIVYQGKLSTTYTKTMVEPVLLILFNKQCEVTCWVMLKDDNIG